MKSSVKYFLLVTVAVLFLITGYMTPQIVEGSESHKQACTACDCTACEKGHSGESIWCESCKVGYKDGHKVKCKSCFEGMTGKKSKWCESCNTGYLKGKKVDCKECCHAGEICKACQKVVEGSESHKQKCTACGCTACEKGHSGESIWCESCKVGYKDGHKVKCKSCFEGMTGKRNEWCESCNAGYLKGRKVDCKECCHAGETCKTCQNK